MKLYAISDLHLAAAPNREALSELPTFGDDWLILAGDTGEGLDHLRWALDVLCARFAKVIWTPGNHDLWTVRRSGRPLRGEEKYRALVEICRSYGVSTPEDPYLVWTGEGPSCTIAPLFLLYDYSFRPDDISESQVLAWSREGGVVCADEILLSPQPHSSRQSWCLKRCRWTEQRLERTDSGLPTILVSHFPLRYDVVHLPRIPRFSPWCGTRLTEDWHLRFRALTVVSGHLHLRTSQERDGVIFEEVSLGYPGDWERDRGIEAYLRRILPRDGVTRPRRSDSKSGPSPRGHREPAPSRGVRLP